jgi:2-methylisocitrate lyase-like PEP mutase family enzyme
MSFAPAVPSHCRGDACVAPTAGSDKIPDVPTPADRLRALLARPGLLLMPGCHDAMSARLIGAAGFDLGFMSGFGVSAARLGMPDAGLLSYGELVDQGRNVCGACSIPLIGDGDTGFGSAQNIKRTVHGYCRAGFAGIMLEDQVAPKRCGHTEGKSIVDLDEALTRIRAAVDARDAGSDILIMARTDARACAGLDEAIRRCRMFREIGADITFLEAPVDEDEMRRYGAEVDGPKMANLIESGRTPWLAPAALEALGYKIAVYPLTLLNVSIGAMRAALRSLQSGERPPAAMDFEQLKRAVGFPEYYVEEARYRHDRRTVN